MQNEEVLQIVLMLWTYEEDRWKRNYSGCLFFLKFNYLLNDILAVFLGTRGGAVGFGTALKAGRSRVRFPMLS